MPIYTHLLRLESVHLHFKHDCFISVHLLQIFTFVMLSTAAKWQLSDVARSRRGSETSILPTTSKTTRFLLPHLNEPPTCMRLSSHLCTVRSALAAKIPHRRAKRFQGQEKLSQYSCWSLHRHKNGAFSPVPTVLSMFPPVNSVSVLILGSACKTIVLIFRSRLSRKRDLHLKTQSRSNKSKILVDHAVVLVEHMLRQ